MALTPVQLDTNTQNLTLFPETVKGTVVYNPGAQSERTKPMIISLENAIRTVDGIRSLTKYSYINAAPSVLPHAFQSRVLEFIQTSNGESGWYFTSNGGGGTRSHLTWDVDNGTWQTLGTISDGVSTRRVTKAKLNGTYYLFNSQEGIYTIDSAFAGITIQTVQGITATNLNGICAGMDYMIGWDEDTIYWSAPNEPLDFRPIVSTVTTGAGSGKLQELTGIIIVCHQIAGGFLIYTSEEIIAARWSGNSKNPWIFNKVKGSGGIAETQEVVGIGSSAAQHFVYTKSGMQEVTLTEAKQVLAAVTDYLASKYYTVSNNDSTFSTNEITSSSKLVSVCFVSNRYLCISYSNTGFASPTIFAGMWIYDTVLSQIGHIVEPHLSAFDYFDPLTDVDDRVGLVGLWNPNGTVDIYRLSAQGKTPTGDTALTGEIIWGEFKLTADKMCSVSSIVLNDQASADFSMEVNVLTEDIDGQQAIGEITFVQTPANGKYFYEYANGVSHRVRISGQFDISSINVMAAQGGSL